MALFAGHGERVADFATRYVVQTKGRWAGEPLKLERWQRSFLDELFLVDGDGRRVYREALLGVGRKNGKSTLAAAIALYGLLGLGEEGAEVYSAAASRDQARVVFDQAAAFVEASPLLRDWLKPMRSAIVCESTGGVYRVLSSDGPLQHGLNPSLVVIDELWAHKSPELFYALTTGQLARLDPLVVSITTAGWDRDTIAWQAYERGRALADQGADAMRAERFLFRWFEAPDGCRVDDPEAWAAANPSSWVDHDDLAREARRLPEPVFRRLHLNQWTDSEDSWVSAGDWDACRGDVRLDEADELWVGVDIGVKRDSSAIVEAGWVEDRLHVRATVLTPSPGRPVAVADVRELVAGMAGDRVREIDFDPHAFRESAQELEERGLPMVEFAPNNARMVPASEKLYELIRERRLVHDGDPVLRSHILAAEAQMTERGQRISKRKSRAHIDACMALAYAADRAADQSPPADDFIWEVFR